MEQIDVRIARVQTAAALQPAAVVSPESLFREHYRTLVQSLALIAGGDRDAAADAASDAFLELERNWDRISAYDEPIAWVRRVALNRLANQRRSFGRRARALARLQSQERQLQEREPSHDPVSSDLAMNDLALKAALNRLPLKQRTAVVLFYFHDLSVAQVAQTMGISEGAVNQHLHRGRKALRISLEVDE